MKRKLATLEISRVKEHTQRITRVVSHCPYGVTIVWCMSNVLPNKEELDFSSQLG